MIFNEKKRRFTNLSWRWQQRLPLAFNSTARHLYFDRWTRRISIKCYATKIYSWLLDWAKFFGQIHLNFTSTILNLRLLSCFQLFKGRGKFLRLTLHLVQFIHNLLTKCNLTFVLLN